MGFKVGWGSRFAVEGLAGCYLEGQKGIVNILIGFMSDSNPSCPMIKLLTKSRDRKRKHEARERLTAWNRRWQALYAGGLSRAWGCSEDRTLITHEKSSLWYSGTISQRVHVVIWYILGL